jgi:hypothetical protein
VVYLTYNDQPSGIYNSQVIDVVKNFNSIQDKESVKLVALISVRGFFKNRNKLKSQMDCKVLPMFPGAGSWKMNYVTLWFLFLLSKPKSIMARGPFATCLALKLKKAGRTNKVIFDSRGAYKAELTEYKVIENKKIVAQIKEIEKEALLGSDLRLAVSQAMVYYWNDNFDYTSNDHVIVPCTLSKEFVFSFPASTEIKDLKKQIGYNEDDVVVVYSGSSAGWQSFKLISDLLLKMMNANPKLKLLMLAHKTPETTELFKDHKERMKTVWVEPKEVRNYLLVADYGILYREPSVTNKVASPVKFGEYLSCGLKVIISEGLGDFSGFSRAQKVKAEPDLMNAVSYEEKLRIHQVAITYLTKEKFKSEYLKLLS